MSDFYLKAGAPSPEPRAAWGPAHRILLQVLGPPSLQAASDDPASRHFGPDEEGSPASGESAHNAPKDRVFHVLLPLSCARTHTLNRHGTRLQLRPISAPPRTGTTPAESPRLAEETVTDGQVALKTRRRPRRDVWSTPAALYTCRP